MRVLYGDSPRRAQPPRKLYIFLLDSNALGVDSAKIRVVEQADEERFGRLLQRRDRLTLPPIGPVLGCHIVAYLADLHAVVSAPVEDPSRSQAH